MQARAIDAQQRALVARVGAHEPACSTAASSRPNEAEHEELAERGQSKPSSSPRRQRSIGTALEVNDCILRAPFDGEVATRTVDPGAFVRPGTAIVSVVDRITVRMTADVPENDFDVVAPGKQVTRARLRDRARIPGTISRRAPAADPDTRTVHFEIDIAGSRTSEIPVDTTGESAHRRRRARAGRPRSRSPPRIADEKATRLRRRGDVAHHQDVHALGEAGRNALSATPALKPGTPVVTEGRALLNRRETPSRPDASALRHRPAPRPRRPPNGGHGQ